MELEAEDAIAVEEAQIQALERFESEQAAASVPALALSPYTFSLEAGVSDDFWDPSPCLPWVLESSSVEMRPQVQWYVLDPFPKSLSRIPTWSGC